MRRGLLLVTLFLIMKPRYSHSRCEEPGSRRSTSDVGFLARNDRDKCQYIHKQKLMFCFSYLQQTIGLDNLKRNILKRYSDLDYDSFVGLMGRRNAGKSSYILKRIVKIIIYISMSMIIQ